MLAVAAKPTTEQGAHMCEITELDLENAHGRMVEMVARLKSELDAPRGCCGELTELTTNTGQPAGEEKLFYILLATHFASPYTADEGRPCGMCGG